jgi:hypothetical protein
MACANSSANLVTLSPFYNTMDAGVLITLLLPTPLAVRPVVLDIQLISVVEVGSMDILPYPKLCREHAAPQRRLLLRSVPNF